MHGEKSPLCSRTSLCDSIKHSRKMRCCIKFIRNVQTPCLSCAMLKVIIRHSLRSITLERMNHVAKDCTESPSVTFVNLGFGEGLVGSWCEAFPVLSRD